MARTSAVGRPAVADRFLTEGGDRLGDRPGDGAPSVPEHAADGGGDVQEPGLARLGEEEVAGLRPGDDERVKVHQIIGSLPQPRTRSR